MRPASSVTKLALTLLLAGCASAPETFTPATPLVTSSGLVIGTLSYHYVDMTESGDAVVVHFQRIDSPAAQDYALPVSVDPETRSGMFDGALPEGVYAFRDAAAAGHSYPAGAMPVPFEVTAGAVRDAGHYALSPVPAR